MHNVTQGLMDLVSPTYDTRLKKTPVYTVISAKNLSYLRPVTHQSIQIFQMIVTSWKYKSVKVFLEDSFDTSLYCAVQLNVVVHEPNDLNGCRDYSRGPAENWADSDGHFKLGDVNAIL